MVIPTEAVIARTDPGERTLTGTDRTTWEHSPPLVDDDPTVLAQTTPESDISDLEVPTRPSIPPMPSPVSASVPVVTPEALASGFDEVPQSGGRDLHREPTQKLHPDDEAPTQMRRMDVEGPTQLRALVVNPPPQAPSRPRRARRSRSSERPLDIVAVKSGLAGLFVGLLILVPITLAVLWSSY